MSVRGFALVVITFGGGVLMAFAIVTALVSDSVTTGEAWGSVEWHIAGGSDESARASIGSVVVLAGTDDPGTPGDVDPTLLVSPHMAPPYPFQLHHPPAPGFAFHGAEQLQRVGEPVGQDNWPTTVEIGVTVATIFPGEGDSAIFPS